MVLWKANQLPISHLPEAGVTKTQLRTATKIDMNAII